MTVSNETLSTETKYATTRENIPGTPTVVTEWDIPDGGAIEIEAGLPAQFDAVRKDDNSKNLPRDSRFGLAYREPGDPLDDFTVIGETQIAPFNSLSQRQQLSGDNAQRRKMLFNSSRVPDGTLRVNESDDLALVMLSSEVVDPSTLFFSYDATFENI